jgi:hypothetical protein
MKKFTLTFFFAATLGLVLHAGHPDSSHAGFNGTHDCAICQTATIHHVPAPILAAPQFVVAASVPQTPVFLSSKSLALLTDTRGPPLS